MGLLTSPVLNLLVNNSKRRQVKKIDNIRIVSVPYWEGRHLLRIAIGWIVNLVFKDKNICLVS